MPAIGIIANFSSLQKHRPKENKIYESFFGKFSNLKMLCLLNYFNKIDSNNLYKLTKKSAYLV